MAGIEILADSVECPASLSGSRTNEIPFAAAEMFRNAFESDAVADRFAAVYTVVELYKPLPQVSDHADRAGRFATACPATRP